MVVHVLKDGNAAGGVTSNGFLLRGDSRKSVPWSGHPPQPRDVPVVAVPAVEGVLPGDVPAAKRQLRACDAGAVGQAGRDGKIEIDDAPQVDLESIAHAIAF